MAKSQAQIKHEQDVATLAKELLRAAKEHDLCDTLFDEIDKINKKLNMPIVVERPAKKATGTLYVSLNFNNPVAVETVDDSWFGQRPECVKNEDDFVARLEKAAKEIVKDMYGDQVAKGVDISLDDHDLALYGD